MEEKKVKSQIKKRSYYSFPNGVEAEDICRYLSFNLGNVVKYICRAGKKNENTKILTLVFKILLKKDYSIKSKYELDRMIKSCTGWNVDEEIAEQQ